MLTPLSVIFSELIGEDPVWDLFKKREGSMHVK
jgi:hypothetical protein